MKVKEFLKRLKDTDRVEIELRLSAGIVREGNFNGYIYYCTPEYSKERMKEWLDRDQEHTIEHHRRKFTKRDILEAVVLDEYKFFHGEITKIICMTPRTYKRRKKLIEMGVESEMTV